MPPQVSPLIRSLPPGPLDIVGDVHGEIDALKTLLDRLGYGDGGQHPDGRRLVFVGDLIDKGPDSPAVLDKLRPWIEEGTAQAVMGNHELNLLVGKVRAYNTWFHGQGAEDNPARQGQTLLAPHRRSEVRDFLATLPLALEREDMRVAHACWHKPHVERLRDQTDPVSIYEASDVRINAELDRDGQHDKIERNLALQNRCPVRAITSGIEERAVKPFKAGGRTRYEARTPWWQTYNEKPFCVFGHYSRTSPQSQNGGGLPLFPTDHAAPVGETMCIDLGVGGRNAERRGEPMDGSTYLAAFRWPERVVVTDRSLGD